MPTWVGDAVMATPTLRALRARLPEAHITLLLRPLLKPLMDAAPWFDRMVAWRKPKPGLKTNARRKTTTLAARLRRGRYDAAVLLPNSLRSAVLVRLAGIPRRIGYRRDGRGPLLTDALEAPRANGQWKPISAVVYYMKLAEALGAQNDQMQPQLHTRPQDNAWADRLCAGLDGAGPLVLLNPGAATKGAAKLWPADRFGALADRLVDRHGARILINGAPNERGILGAVKAAASVPMCDLLESGGNLKRLKSVMAKCRLVISNDTGGRHVAVAMGTPVISLFGPTDPAWTQWVDVAEQIIRAPDGRMDQIGLQSVLDLADKQLDPCET